MTRRHTGPKVAVVILLGTGVLTGCDAGPGSGSTDQTEIEQPTPATTTPAASSTARPSSRPTPSNTAPTTASATADPAYLALSRQQRKAFDAAVEVYQFNRRTVRRIGESGQYTDEEIKRELAKSAADPRANEDFLILRTYRIKGELETGALVHVWFRPEAVNIDLRKSRAKLPEVRMLVCDDNSQIRQLDVKTHKVLWAPTPGDTRAVTWAKLRFIGATWRVVELDRGDEDKLC